MKTCFKCNRQLPPEEFYRHPMMGDGRLGKCKVCTRKDVRENYAKRREQYLEYERQRYGPERVASIWASKQRHPERDAARKKVQAAVKAGRIVKLPCEVCGDSKSEGHHDDYTKPLEVRWLCRRHHREAHRLPDAA